MISRIKQIKQSLYKIKQANIPKYLIYLFIIALCFEYLFINLSLWQYNRSLEKQEIINKLNSTDFISSNINNNLNNVTEYSKIRLYGQFDNQNSILLENQIYNHQLGYNIITPFIDINKNIILVNRGWVKNYQDFFKEINNQTNNYNINNKIYIYGIIKNYNNKYIMGNNISQNNNLYFIQKVNPQDVNKQKILPYYINIDKKYLLLTKTDNSNNSKKSNKLNNTFTKNWNLVNISPEKHLGYSIQWALLAISIIILYGYLVYKK